MIYCKRTIGFIFKFTGVHMSTISYNNLFKLLIDKGIKKTELAQMADISQTTLAKFSKNQYVSMDVLVKYVTV